MTELWLSLAKIPAEGRDFSFSDQAVWTDPIREFALPYRIVEPLQADLHVSPQKNGCYIRGRLKGKLEVPCDRCAEESVVNLDEAFDFFEELGQDGDKTARTGLLRHTGEFMELDVAALLWEQFMLALPAKPLCAEGCLGICPGCGTNLNTGQCRCRRDGEDHRLTLLKGVRIQKK